VAMADHAQHSRKKAALVSAVVCGVIGPGMPVLAIALANTSSFRVGLSQLTAIPVIWAAVVVWVGPAGFLLGAAYGAVLHAIAQRLRSNWSGIIVAALLGLVFGSAVPFVSVAIGLRITYDTIGEMETAAPT